MNDIKTYTFDVVVPPRTNVLVKDCNGVRFAEFTNTSLFVNSYPLTVPVEKLTFVHTPLAELPEPAPDGYIDCPHCRHHIYFQVTA